MLPFTRTCIFVFVNVLFAKYLSVTWNVNCAVLFFTSTDESIFSTKGLTTSTISAVPVPSGKSIPDVMVVALFPFPDVSVILFAPIATVTTPL